MKFDIFINMQCSVLVYCCFITVTLIKMWLILILSEPNNVETVKTAAFL